MKSITNNLDHKKNDKCPVHQHLGVYISITLPDSSSWLPGSEAEKIHEDKYELGRLAFHKTEQIQLGKEESKQGKELSRLFNYAYCFL